MKTNVSSSHGIRMKFSDSQSKPSEQKMLFVWIMTFFFFITIFLLILIPNVRSGAEVLANRLFRASEAVNAYAYEYFDVSDDHPVAAAVILLSVMLVCVLSLAVILRSPILILALAAIYAGMQAYFGLSLPGWMNVLFYSCLGLLLMQKKMSPGVFVLFVGLLSVTVLLIMTHYPGVDPWIESRSEELRDLLTRSLPPEAFSAAASDELLETRHLNSRSLISGNNEAVAQQEFRLVTEEEEQISLPEWAEELSFLLPVLLVLVLLLCAGFLAVQYVKGRKHAAEKRLLFNSWNRAEAVCAMFGHIAAWLDSFGYGCGNIPYREWPQNLMKYLPVDYTEQFSACVPVLEMALYSDHQPADEQWQNVCSLLNETEKLLYDQADWKKRFRLRFVEFLYQ